jgi:hypothetical protein
MGRRHVVVALAARPGDTVTLYILRRLFPLPSAPCLALTRQELEAEFLPALPDESAA